jgi:hypothetical protein
MQQNSQGGDDEEKLIDHPNALASWFGLRLTTDATLQVLFVETDLVLDTKDDAFDARSIESLVAKIREFHAANSFEGVDIIPTMR